MLPEVSMLFPFRNVEVYTDVEIYRYHDQWLLIIITRSDIASLLLIEICKFVAGLIFNLAIDLKFCIYVEFIELTFYLLQVWGS